MAASYRFPYYWVHWVGGFTFYVIHALYTMLYRTFAIIRYRIDIDNVVLYWYFD